MSKEKMSVSSKIDYAVFENANLTKDQIKGWLQADIRGVYLLLAEMLGSVEVLDALSEVFFKRYLKFHEEKKEAQRQQEAQQELDFKK